MIQLKDKVAIITGGARGIGKVTASVFLSLGARVTIWDVDEKRGHEAVADWQKQGYAAMFQRVDTTSLEAVQAAASHVAAQWGQIDILINNAGITRDASMKKMSSEQWQQVIDVNLTGVFYCTQAVSAFMVERGYGRIISASSIVALYGNYGQSNYVATKAGLIGMTKVWARELGPKGITVNAVAPGFINTEMIKTVPEHIIEGLCQRTPLRKLGEPEDIAWAYAFLASDLAGFITGTTLSVDGGLVT